MNTRILLVAYEDDILQSFPVTLRQAGHRVVLARGGLQAIEQARSTSPDLIVVDAALPDMDGPTVEGILRRLPSTSCIPTILIKPRPHKLMPAALQLERASAGSAEPLLEPEAFLHLVDATLAHRQSEDLEQQLAQEAI